MIEPSMFVRMMMKRLAERKAAHTENIKKGLKRKEYHTICGRIKEIDDLVGDIEEFIRTGQEDDDDEPDRLTRRQTWPANPSTSTPLPAKPKSKKT